MSQLDNLTEISVLARLRRGTIEAFVLQATGAVLLFGMQIVLARALGKEGYGVFSYAVALAGVLAAIVPLGWPTALMRFIAQYREQGQWNLLRGAVRRAYQITALTTMLATLLLWATSYLMPIPTGISTSVRFAALLLPFLAFVSLRRKALQGLQKVRLSIIPEDILLPILVIAGVFVLAVSNPSSALLIYACAGFVAFIVGSYWLRQSMPGDAGDMQPEYRTRAWMTVALPMVFGGFSQVVMNRTSVLMLGALSGADTVGLYASANRIAMLSTFVLVAASTMAAPMMAAAYHGGRTAEIRRVLRGAMLFSTIGALPLLVAAIFFPQFLLGFFGTEFVDGANILRVLAAGQFFNAVTGPIGFVLLMTGRERTFALTTAIVATATVAGNLVVIPAYGAIGAAIVTGVSVVFLNTWQYLLSRASI